MCVRKTFDNRILFLTGTSLVAFQIVLRQLFSGRAGGADAFDFASGVLLGVGLGLLLLCLWRLRRANERLKL